MKKLVCFLALTPVCAFAQTLSTLGPNNGSGGVFFDLTAAGNNLSFNSFATYFGSTTVGTPASVEVWVRSGSFVGFTTANTGWTLYETVAGTAAGTGTLSAPIAFTTPIALTAGSTTGFYVHSITAGNGIRYQGTGTTSTSTFSNADITLFSNVARTGAVSFGGSQFTPRAFSGDINYTVSSVPEPASMAALGLGLAALLRRKKKSAK
jgi:PEP-CTERM motif